MAAGNDTKLYIKRPPIDFKFILIAEHTSNIINVKTKLSGIPHDFEISLLKNSAIIPLWKTTANNINTNTTIKLKTISFEEDINKFPQKKENKSVKCSLNKPATRKAMAMLKENNKIIETLFWLLIFLDIGLIINADTIQNIKPDKIGFIPRNKPIMAPAKAQCAIVTPINGIFNNNIHTPIIPQDKPARIDNIIALLKKE